MIAIALAVIDAFCFAAAAVFQQRAVRGVLSPVPAHGEKGASAHRRLVQHGTREPLAQGSVRLSMHSLPSLMRRPGWLRGLALMSGGAGLHAVALALAPVSVLQPIGVLGVPIAVLLAAHTGGRRPHRGAIVPMLICLISIASFVGLASRYVGDGAVPGVAELLVAQTLVLAAIIVFDIVGRLVDGWLHSVLYAVGGAIGVGMVSVLMRGVTQLLGGHPSHAVEPRMMIMVVLLIGNGLLGAWMIHQAYASGTPEVVLACLTVVDPMIAVLAGFVLLAEGTDLAGEAVLGMLGLGSTAMIGVCLLARFHPEVSERRVDHRCGSVSEFSVTHSVGNTDSVENTAHSGVETKELSGAR